MEWKEVLCPNFFYFALCCSERPIKQKAPYDNFLCVKEENLDMFVISLDKLVFAQSKRPASKAEWWNHVNPGNITLNSNHEIATWSISISHSTYEALWLKRVLITDLITLEVTFISFSLFEVHS